MTDARFKRAERRVAEMLGTRRTPLSGGNSAHTRSDTLHPDLYVEVKLAKRPPLWDRMHELRKRARRVGRSPLTLVTHPDNGPRLVLMDLEDMVAFNLDRDDNRILDLLDVFLVEHVPLRRSAWFSLFQETKEKAELERKRPLVVYKASGRPGEVCGFELRTGWTVGGP